MRVWYVVSDSKPTGPYTDEELEDLIIKPDTFMKSSGMDDYKEAHEIPEIRELMGFKQHITLPQYFATLDLRLLAVAIDYLLVFVVYVFLSLIILSFVNIQSFRIIISAAGLILVPVVKFGYACVMEASQKQGTFGKFWLGIKVCNEQGAPLNASKSVIRNVSKLVSVLTFGIGYLSGFFNKKQQCLHDIIAGTLVIKDRLV